MSGNKQLRAFHKTAFVLQLFRQHILKGIKRHVH